MTAARSCRRPMSRSPPASMPSATSGTCRDPTTTSPWTAPFSTPTWLDCARLCPMARGRCAASTPPCTGSAARCSCGRRWMPGSPSRYSSPPSPRPTRTSRRWPSRTRRSPGRWTSRSRRRRPRHAMSSSRTTRMPIGAPWASVRATAGACSPGMNSARSSAGGRCSGCIGPALQWRERSPSPLCRARCCGRSPRMPVSVTRPRSPASSGCRGCRAWCSATRRPSATAWTRPRLRTRTV